MNIDLDELKQAIAGYPTEGWRHKNNSPDTFLENLKREEAYHEAVNPQTVLALLAEVERLRAENQALEERLENAYYCARMTNDLEQVIATLDKLD